MLVVEEQAAVVAVVVMTIAEDERDRMALQDKSLTYFQFVENKYMH